MPNIAPRVQTKAGKGAFDIWEKALALEATGVDIIHFEIGEPDFETPAHIVAAANQALADGYTKYDLPNGLPRLRGAMADYIQRTRNLPVGADRVIVTPGVKGTLFTTIMAIIGDGDEILVPDPGYPMYSSTLNYANGRAVPYPLRPENQFQPDPDDIKAAINANTKAILLNSPGNPTGTIHSRESLEQFANIALEHDLWIVSDEVYAQLYFTDDFPLSIAALPDMAERTIIMDGCSKAYAMTGWRVGFGIFPETLVQAVDTLASHTHSCLPPFIQIAAEAAFRGPQDCVEMMRQTYQARRDFVLTFLADYPEIKTLRPDGAFYIMLDLSAITGPDVNPFAYKLLSNGVSVLPGDVMGDMTKGFVRLALNHPQDVLAEGLQRLVHTLYSPLNLKN
ncbi:MAG: pyridoxal phosphate-dependent aminotransferase [Chloroflexota bacterium]